MSTVRRRNVALVNEDEIKSDFYSKIRSLDAFTKITEEAETPKTVQGGFCAFVTFMIMLVLFVGEMQLWFFHTKIKYEFDVDTEYEAKMNLNIDITVNTPCFGVGADIIDSSGDAWRYNFQINEEGTDFQLKDKAEDERLKLLQMKEQMSMSNGNGLKEALIREGHNATHLEHSMKANKQMMDSGYMHKVVEIKMGPDEPKACRFWGSIPLHKVAGKVRITAGKGGLGPLSAIMGLFGAMGGGPMGMFGGQAESNFSHRIDHFSFGSPTSGLLYPLDGEVEVQSIKDVQFNYVIKVVPTKLKTFRFTTTTYQYAVTQHTKTSEQNPGIFFQYDFSGLGVEISEYRESFIGLLTRLAGILGGIFASSGIIASIMSFVTSKY